MNSRTILRWIVLLPASLISSVVAWYLVTIGNYLVGGRPGEGILSIGWRGCVEILAGLAFGYVFIYAGAYVAPGHKKHTVYVLSGIGFLLIGACLFAAFMTRNYWAVLSNCSAVAGIAGAVWAFHKNQVIDS